MHENEISKIALDIGYMIHRTLGPGLYESVYETVLSHELRKRGLVVEQQVPIPLIWDGIRIDVAFRADLIVDHKFIVEVKSVEANNPGHRKQLLTYLQLAECRLGLVMNFGLELFKDGVSRVVNGLCDLNQVFPLSSSKPSGTKNISLAP